jgi:predicted dehydrogenase
MRRARIGLVGAGWWSSRVHLPAIKENPLADLVVICDADIERAKDASQFFQAKHFVNSIHEALSFDLDCLLVATPHDSHFEPAISALSQGVDVMIEKPMTIIPEEAWLLVRQARKNNCSLHMGYTFPHSVHTKKLREMISGNVLGDLLAATALFAGNVAPLYRDPEGVQNEPGTIFKSRPMTYTNKAKGGGQLYTQTTHSVSTMLWMTNSIPRSISSIMDGDDQTVDTSNFILVKMQGNLMASFGSSGALLNHDDRLEEYRIIGEKGHALLDTNHGSLQTSVNGQKMVEQPRLSSDLANPVNATSQVLVSTFLDKTPVVASGILGALTVEVLEAARLSAISKKAIQIFPQFDLDGNELTKQNETGK